MDSGGTFGAALQLSAIVLCCSWTAILYRTTRSSIQHPSLGSFVHNSEACCAEHEMLSLRQDYGHLPPKHR
jgi:hypothetical protein